MTMAATVTHKSLPTLDILVVEEQPEILASIRDALGKRGHRVTAAIDGNQARDRLETRRFDVAICDMRDRSQDESELLRLMRRHDPSSELIVMNGTSNGLERGSPFGDRSTHHLGRPFDLERLMTLVGRVAEQRRVGAPSGTRPRLADEAPYPAPQLGGEAPHAAPQLGGATPRESRVEGTAAASIEPLVEAMKRFERGYLLRALDQCEWQRTRTAGMLGISRKTLWQKLKLHRIADSESA